MPTRYAVFQYVPDPVAGERVNFGVVVYDEQTVLVRFVNRWQRIKSFAGKDVTFLRHFSNRVEESADPSILLTDVGKVVRLDEDLIRTMSQRWLHSIQLTEPRVGLLEPRKLLDQVSIRFLREGDVRKRDGLSRRVAARAVLTGVRAALEEEATGVNTELAKELLKPGGFLQGVLTSSRFDAVVGNGVPVLAAHGASFQSQNHRLLEAEVNSISFGLTDVRRRYAEMPLALAVIPPRVDVSGEYARALEICAGLGVDVVGVEGVESWARPVVRDYLR